MQSNKKIVIISDFAYPIVGGTEKYVFESAKYFSKTNKVRIISPVWSPENVEEDFKYKKFSKNLDIIRFKGRFRRNKYIKPIKFLLKLVRYCRDYNVINGHYYSNALVTILFAKLFRKKSVITLYEVENLLNRKGLNLLNKADKIIVISDALKKYAEEKGLKNVKVICPWIEIKKIRYNQKKLKEKYGLKNKIVVLYTGRIIKTKGVGYLIRAIPLIKKEIKNIKVVLIGAKIDKELLKLPSKLGVSGNCAFLGFVSEKEKDDYCKLCDVIIYPPYYKGGFGFALLEAMKYNKPGIGSDNWGVPDAVGNGGIVVPQKNAKAIAKAIIKIMSNEKLRKDLEKKAGAHAKKFEKNRVLNKYKELLLKWSTKNI